MNIKSILHVSDNNYPALRSYKVFPGVFDNTKHHKEALGTITNVNT